MHMNFYDLNTYCVNGYTEIMSILTCTNCAPFTPIVNASDPVSRENYLTSWRIGDEFV